MNGFLTVIGRPAKLCNFLEWRGNKIVYKRYASLYFVAGIKAEDNELIALEIIHLFVEVLDRYFGNVCELDLIFNFHKGKNCFHLRLKNQFIACWQNLYQHP